MARKALDEEFYGESCESYHRLKKLNPNHYLLGYVFNVDGEGFMFVRDKQKELLDRFVKDRKVEEGVNDYFFRIFDAVRSLQDNERKLFVYRSDDNRAYSIQEVDGVRKVSRVEQR